MKSIDGRKEWGPKKGRQRDGDVKLSIVVVVPDGPLGDADILPRRRIHTAVIKGFLVEDHIMLQQDKCHTQRLQFPYFISWQVERAFKYS